MQELADSEGIDVDCLGGGLRSLSQSFVGPLAEAALERMSFDRVFLGADAVTAEDGIYEADHAQTRLKELLARRGNNVYVLADSSKLGLRPFHAWARLALPWTLVTDDGADPAQLQKFREAGVEVREYCIGCRSIGWHEGVARVRLAFEQRLEKAASAGSPPTASWIQPDLESPPTDHQPTGEAPVCPNG